MLKVGVGVHEHGLAQCEEAVDIPRLNRVRVGVNVEGEVEVVRDHSRFGSVASLEHVQALDDQNVWPVNDDFLVIDDVVGKVGVDRSVHRTLPGLYVLQEREQRGGVVALGETLAGHQVAPFQLRIGMEETVRRDQRDVGMFGPTCEKRLEESGGGALPDRHAATDTDDVGERTWSCSKKGMGHRRQRTSSHDVQIDQPAQGQIDLFNFVEVEPFVYAAHFFDVVLVERQGRRITKRCPRLTIKVLKAVCHRYILWSRTTDRTESDDAPCHMLLTMWLELRQSAFMDADHKAKLAQGRRDARAVKAYLEFLESNRPKRGRRRTEESIAARLSVIDSEIEGASPLARLNLYQEQTDLAEELEAMKSRVDGTELRAAFVEAAARYGESKGIQKAAFRQMGVDAATIREAKIR